MWRVLYEFVYGRHAPPASDPDTPWWVSTRAILVLPIVGELGGELGRTVDSEKEGCGRKGTRRLCHDDECVVRDCAGCIIL